MSNLSNITSDIEIQRPELWNLMLRLDEDAITFMVYSDKIDNSIISRQIPLDKASGSYLRAIENAVYDNPMLLLDYNSVKVMVRSERFIISPSQFGEGEEGCELLEELFTKMYGTADGEVFSSELYTGGPIVTFEMPKGVEQFLRRTFNNPPVVHHLSSLARYFHAKSASSGISKMYMHFDGAKMELCLFKRGEFVMANTFKCRAPQDALYFAMHAWQSYGCDAMVDEMQLSGSKTVRDELKPLLRKYVNYVMPVIFPATAMKLGEDAIKAPFDLILLSICE